MLAAFHASPRAGHLEAVFHIFAYLQSHSRTKNGMECNEWNLHYELFNEEDWSDFYADAEDVFPPNMPTPRGKTV